MRAKPDLVPDCDVHGEPMYRDECAASALGLKGDREEVVWRCPHEECGRYFHGTVGYRSHVTIASRAIPTPRCERGGSLPGRAAHAWLLHLPGRGLPDVRGLVRF